MNATIAIIVFIIVYGLILTEKIHRAIAALLGNAAHFVGGPNPSKGHRIY